jgi:pseudaminic acid biosynthesis-associated methylase
MTDYQTLQESFWAGKFGDEYVGRNRGASWIGTNTALFAKILNRTNSVRSILEIGPNIGLNLRAIRNLLPEVELSGVEINEAAVRELRNWGEMKNVIHQSLLDYKPIEQFDFVFTKGVLIHLCPERLPDVYQLLHGASRQYICIAEYYNPSPVSVPYRGHDDKLFKRDFAGEIMDLYPDLELVDYGFCYHRDSYYPQDDITWFLLRKTGGFE